MKWKGLDIDPRLISESSVVKPRLSPEAGFTEATTENGVRYLLPQIEAIHAGSTRNNTRYLADKLKGHEELKSGVFSWTKPYPKPIIYNHDVETEATGRVHTASFTEYTVAGRPGIIVVPKISHPKAIKDILDGRLLTVSIGATTDSAVCTICHTDIINEGFCGHMRGESYDGETAEWTCGNLWFDELSWVNVPADQDAMVVNIGDMQQPFNASRESTNRESIVVTESHCGCSCKHTTENKEDENMPVENTPVQEPTPVVEPEQTTEATPAVPETTPAPAVTESTPVVEPETPEAPVAPEAPTESQEVADLKAEVKRLQDALKVAEQELKDEQEARQDLVTANTGLSEQLRESKVSHLVDLRVALGKESDRETAVAKFKERSTESLTDSIADMLTESVATPVAPAPRVVERVQNPVAEQLQQTQTPATNLTEGLTAEQVLVRMFGGKR